ncbi:MAG: hypothetical protein KC621_09035 [Myxococcales bacterium]|nr:hypothetical protein [Myxococcales bacterium]
MGLALVAGVAWAEPVFESAEGVGAAYARTPEGDVEGAAVLHSQGFGNLMRDRADVPWGTYGGSGGSLGLGNAGLSLEGKGDGGILVRPATVIFPAVGVNLGLGLRADTAQDEIGKPGNSNDWIQGQVEAGAGFGLDLWSCRTLALARIGGAAGGEGVPGHGLRYGPLAQLDCPGVDVALSAARTEKDHSDGRPTDLVDTASLQVAFTVDRKHGIALGLRGEAVALNEVYDSELMDTRGFFVIEMTPRPDDDDDDDE